MIDEFKGEYAFLSNFYPCKVYGYPSNEHFFAAMKTLDKAEREAIRMARTAGQAKRMGRRAVLRDDWMEIREQVMYTGLLYKFSDPKLKEMLLATGDAVLVEGNVWHDQYWGNCICDEHAGDDGANVLGMQLMVLRAELGRD